MVLVGRPFIASPIQTVPAGCPSNISGPATPVKPIPTSTFNFRRHPSAIAAAVSELTTPYWSIVSWGIPNNFSFALAA